MGMGGRRLGQVRGTRTSLSSRVSWFGMWKIR